MAPRMTERLMNLTICLLEARRYVSRDEIRRAVGGYEGLSDDAFGRAFERDKAELLALNIPLELGANDPAFAHDEGYRIKRSAYELRPIEFTKAEEAVIGLAARAWQRTALASEAADAAAKLEAIGVELGDVPFSAATPAVAEAEPALDTLWVATRERRQVGFAYKGHQRVLEPWHLAYRRGSWYVRGRDVDKGQTRTFKLSRMSDVTILSSKPGAYRLPKDLDLAAFHADIQPPAADSQAVVGIRSQRAAALARRGEQLGHVPGLPDGFEAYRIPFAFQADFVGEVCRYGADVVVLEPKALRERVIGHLSAVATGAS